MAIAKRIKYLIVLMFPITLIGWFRSHVEKQDSAFFMVDIARADSAYNGGAGSSDACSSDASDGGGGGSGGDGGDGK